MVPTSYDAIIIGSGLGGLSCGAYLSKNGWKVLVLEKHSLPGGYASSFKRGDYTFDVGLHMLDGVGRGQSMGRFFELCGVSNNIEFIKINYFMRLVFPEHDIRLPCRNLEAVVKLFEHNFLGEKDGIHSLFKEMENILAIVLSQNHSNYFGLVGLVLFAVSLAIIVDPLAPHIAFLQTIVTYGYFVWVLLQIFLVWRWKEL